MFRFMLQKLRHKKWLALCMLIGNILLVAVAAGYPMFQEASLQRMLQDEFDEYQTDTGMYPGLIKMSASASKGEYKKEFLQIEDYATRVCNELLMKQKEYVAYQSLTTASASSNILKEGEEEQKLKISTLAGLSDHVGMISGRMYENTVTTDGFLEAVVTEACLVERNLLLDEELTFQSLKDREGKPIKVRVVGVVKNKESNDLYFLKSPEEYQRELFISTELFTEWFRGDAMDSYSINASYMIMTDTDSLSHSDVAAAKEKVKSLLTLQGVGKTISCDGLTKVLPIFIGKEKKIDATLMILQVPVLALLAAFLFMISGQMLSMEQNEISLLKSRGAGKGQIIRLYLMQNCLLAGLSFLLGIPLGVALCKLLGSSTAFLEFSGRRALTVTLTKDVFLYTAIALAVSIFLTLLPVLRYSNVSIVHVKQKKAHAGKKLWQKLYLDIVITGIALYGFYSFHGRLSELKEKVVAGEALDPLLYLSSALFMLGAGMLFLRLQPLFVKLLYLILKKSLKPAGYASFLQTIRTGAKQQFIMLFLVLTVSLGVFNATVARTIIANAEQNTEYLSGANLVVKEYWKNNEAYVAKDPSAELSYTEPDFAKYSELPHVEAATQVFQADVTVKQGKENIANSALLAIKTDEYGKMVLGDRYLNDYSMSEYLNVLSRNPEAVLLSDNYRTKQKLKIGDSITYVNAEGSQANGTVYGFFTYFSGYVPTIQEEMDGEVITNDNYLIVAHLSYVQDRYGVRPYYVYLKTDITSADFFYEWAAKNGYSYTSVRCLDESLAKLKTDTLFQGTNGILTLSFIIILLLCGVGYLIYWILSIKERELLFGILRAMGMRKNEILTMLFTEQVFCGVLSIAFGALVGLISSRLYVPMIQIAYAADNQVLPQTLITNGTDMLKLFAAIAVMLVVCVIVLIRSIASMKITNALKLGED